MASQVKTIYTSKQITINECLSLASKRCRTCNYIPSEFRNNVDQDFCGTPLELLTSLKVFSEKLYSYYFSEYPLKRDENRTENADRHAIQRGYQPLHGCCCFPCSSRLAVVIAFGSTKEVALNACCAQLIAIYIDRHMASFLLECFRRSLNENNFVLYSEPVACAEIQTEPNHIIKEGSGPLSPVKAVRHSTMIPHFEKSQHSCSEISAFLPNICQRPLTREQKITTLITDNRTRSDHSFAYCNKKSEEIAITKSSYEPIKTTSMFNEENVVSCHESLHPTDKQGERFGHGPSFSTTKRPVMNNNYIDKTSKHEGQKLNSEDRKLCSEVESCAGLLNGNLGQNLAHPENVKSRNENSAILDPKSSEMNPKQKHNLTDLFPSLDEWECEELKLLIAEDKPLFKPQMRKFASILTQANNYPTPALLDYRLQDAITVDEFLTTNQFPKDESLCFKPTLISFLRAMRGVKPKQIVNRMKPWSRQCSVRYYHIADQATLIPRCGKRLILGIRGNEKPTTYFIACASNCELARQACYAKFIQHCLQDTYVARRSLNFFLEKFSAECRKPLVLFNVPKPELPTITLGRERKIISPTRENSVDKAQKCDSILYPLIKVRKLNLPASEEEPPIPEKKHESSVYPLGRVQKFVSPMKEGPPTNVKQHESFSFPSGRVRKPVSPVRKEPSGNIKQHDSISFPVSRVRKFISPTREDFPESEKEHNPYHENEILKQKLSELKKELDQLRLSNELKALENPNTITNEFTTFNCNTVTDLKQNEYVHSLIGTSIYEDNKGTNFHVTINLNDCYFLSEYSTIGFDDAFQRVLQRALNLVKVIESRPEELILPSDLAGDHQMLLNFLKLKTGLSNSSLIMRFKYDLKGWKAMMDVDNVRYKTKNGKETQLEAAANLVRKYLLKHFCTVVDID